MSISCMPECVCICQAMSKVFILNMFVPKCISTNENVCINKSLCLRMCLCLLVFVSLCFTVIRTLFDYHNPSLFTKPSFYL
jgi:hypothetical protein